VAYFFGTRRISMPFSSLSRTIFELLPALILGRNMWFCLSVGPSAKMVRFTKLRPQCYNSGGGCACSASRCRFSCLVLKNIVTLKSWLGSPFDGSHASSFSSSIITMTLSCIVSEIKQDIGRKSRFFHTTFI